MERQNQFTDRVRDTAVPQLPQTRGNPAPSAATESVATDSVQRQNDGQFASLLERLDTLDKCLDKSLARMSESENYATSDRALDDIDSVGVSSQKKSLVGAGPSRYWAGGVNLFLGMVFHRLNDGKG